MQLRGNLFIKIFIAFWLMTITLLATWMLSADYFDSRPMEAMHPGHRPPGPPQRFMLRTIYELQTQDDTELKVTVQQARKKHGVEIYLLDANNTDLLGRKVPRAVARTARLLADGRRRAFLQTPRERLIGHDIYRREQGPLRAIFVLPEPRLAILNALGGNPLLRVALAMLASGIVCFGLSRLLTRRLKELQSASRRLADGELDTRLDVRSRGGDETDELARDFNTMAGQLQERIGAQKRLLGDVSHELRSPLARLRIALALAQNDPAASAGYLARMEQETERLETLIGQLLDSQAGELALDDHIDLVALLQELCTDASFEGQAQGKTVAFSCEVEQAVVASAGDLLHRSFDNILRNALTHTPDNSTVTVALCAQGPVWRVAIDDQGPGVAADQLEQIFTEFYRADSARSRDTGGYGLGLAIARRAINRHGGRIYAENTGDGLRLTVELPAQT